MTPLSCEAHPSEPDCACQIGPHRSTVSRYKCSLENCRLTSRVRQSTEPDFTRCNFSYCLAVCSTRSSSWSQDDLKRCTVNWEAKAYPCSPMERLLGSSCKS